MLLFPFGEFALKIPKAKDSTDTKAVRVASLDKTKRDIQAHYWKQVRLWQSFMIYSRLCKESRACLMRVFLIGYGDNRDNAARKRVERRIR